MDLLMGLLHRRAVGKLQEPAPNAEQLLQIQRAALNVPDHARIRPWRFLTVAGEARNKLGALYVHAGLSDEPDMSADAQQKLQDNPLRAPLLVVVIAKVQDHPKVPRDEQLLSAGCAAHNMLLAAQALGFAGIWRTGPMATHAVVKQGLGLSASEEIVGFIYLGTAAMVPKAPEALDLADYWQSWGV